MPRTHWNPYAAGFVLGLVLLASFVLVGRGLGASGAFSSIAAAIAGAVSPEHVAANAVHARYWNDGAPLASFLVFLMAGVLAGAAASAWHAGRLALRVERGPRIGDAERLALALAGGILVAWGARIAHGCTSGQALSGTAMLSVGGLVFMAAVFAGAYSLSYAMRKAWL